MNDGMHQQAFRIDKDMAIFAFDPPPSRIGANIARGLFDRAVFGEAPADAASVLLDRGLAALPAA